MSLSIMRFACFLIYNYPIRLSRFLVKNTLNLFVCFVLFSVSSAILADTSTGELSQPILPLGNQTAPVIEQQNQLLQANIQQLKKQINEKNLLPEQVSKNTIEQAKIDEALNNANIDELNISLIEAKQASDDAQVRLSILQGRLQKQTLMKVSSTEQLREKLSALQDLVKKQKNVVKDKQDIIDALLVRQELLNQYNLLSKRWIGHINDLYQLNLSQARQMALKQQQADLRQQQQFWLNKLSSLEEELRANSTSPDFDHATAKLKLLQAQEQSNLLHLQLVSLGLAEQLSVLQQNKIQPQMDDSSIETAQLNAMLTNIAQLQKIITRKIELLSSRSKVEYSAYSDKTISKEQLDVARQIIMSLKISYQKQQQQLNELSSQVTAYMNQSEKKLDNIKKEYFLGFGLHSWRTFMSDVVNIPQLTFESLLVLKEQIILSYNNYSFPHLWWITGVVFIWGLLCWLLDKGLLYYLNRNIRQKHLANRVLFISIRLFQKNIWAFYLIGTLAIILMLLHVASKSFSPFLALIVVGFVFKVLVDTARMVLLNTPNSSMHDKKLYRELKYGLFIGALVTMSMLLVHNLPLGYEVVDFFNRLFMLFMLIISTVLLRHWQTIPALAEKNKAIERLYLSRLVKLLSFLVPFTFFSTALIGVLGYVSFAWHLARYEGIFLLVLTSYLLFNGVWNDLAEWLSEQSIKRLKNGWLYTRLILKPLDNLVRILLFLAIFVALYYFYQLTPDSLIVKWLHDIADFDLIQIKSAVITPLVIIDFIIAGIIIYWASRWTRELTYRWLFASSPDIGLRTSLSAFSQYAVVIIGFLVALQVIGIDLSGISYILGGLAFGAAFGLRDLVKNYASGVLMLIERTIHPGDLVSIGGHEGEVTQVGMRYLTLKTWDHIEVLVPNSETFEKPFTNWTHFDSIIRTVVPIKISREDDPALARELISEVLKQNSHVVVEPAPQIYLAEMSQALMSFDVRYYINLQQGKSIAEVRSEVLYAIHAIFKVNHIKLPYASQDIYIREKPL